MKRVGYLFDRITVLDNLLLASKKAFRGKKRKPRVAAFYFNLEHELVALHRELLSGAYQPRPYRTFIIYEPKKRQICAADFRDRVVHHAICNLLDPLFESGMISDTYACRINKGTHAAVDRTQHFVQRYPYFLRCDIRKYFDSIDHEVLKALIRRKIKDTRLLSLLDLIIDQPLPGSRPGKGLPIGNLTSQYFANVYLGQLDHFLKDRLGVNGFIRYMDDFILFGKNKSVLKEHLESIRDYVDSTLHLELKEKAILLAPVKQGISFLGFRVFPGIVRLDNRKWARFKRIVRKLEQQFIHGEIDEEELARRVAAMIGHVQHANTLEARRTFFSESLYTG